LEVVSSAIWSYPLGVWSSKFGALSLRASAFERIARAPREEARERVLAVQ